ncbi:hypothetical protein DPMN_118409 [Dreissena polymorpha]|uniref:Uncharacterized protein n=1 Tax=Dreissena polymorpha TaxID=45954 RepID=A0A9D4GK49_DREPO|nr:hypothetical protein DPMN_118409 [Dreissena polymorpha]
MFLNQLTINCARLQDSIVSLKRKPNSKAVGCDIILLHSSSSSKCFKAQTHPLHNSVAFICMAFPEIKTQAQIHTVCIGLVAIKVQNPELHQGVEPRSSDW